MSQSCPCESRHSVLFPFGRAIDAKEYLLQYRYLLRYMSIESMYEYILNAHAHVYVHDHGRGCDYHYSPRRGCLLMDDCKDVRLLM